MIFINLTLLQGLGKTVISLALILKNPSPRIPESGGSVLKIEKEPDRSGKEPFWDPNLYEQTSESCKKRGSIISHGTLVVVRLPVFALRFWMVS
jgi:hypothetical protein